MRVSEIRVKQIRVNQGLGVCFFFKYLMMETLQAYQLYCKQRTQIAPGPDETTVAKSQFSTLWEMCFMIF